MKGDVKALIYDVFGTCVDWRNGVAREAAVVFKKIGVDVDPLVFAVAWRDKYQPQMETVRTGKRPWTILDVLHRESLVSVMGQFGLTGKLSEDEIDDFNRARRMQDVHKFKNTFAGLVG